MSTTVQVPIAVCMVLLSLLMVSTVRYRTFKDVRLSGRAIGVFGAVVLLGAVVATQLHPSLVLVAYFSAYLVMGLIESVLLLVRSQRANRRLAGPGAEQVDEREYL